MRGEALDLQADSAALLEQLQRLESTALVARGQDEDLSLGRKALVMHSFWCTE